MTILFLSNLYIVLLLLLFLHLIAAVPCKTQHTVLLQPLREIADGLRVQSDKPFKIALFADLHFGENAWTDWGPRQDVNSIKVMSTVLDLETPDFVVYLGDVITANNIAIPNASLYWDQALSPAKARNIPWASVFGNHDDAPFEWPMTWFSGPGNPPLICPVANSSYPEEACSFRGTPRLELMKHEIEHNELSLSKNGPSHLWPSVSNYVLQVSSSKDPESSAMFLYFLDSGGGSYPEVISSAQAEWFRLTSQKLNPDLRVPEVVFWHIPSKYYKKVAPKFWIHKPCVGSINKERVAAQEAEYDIMDILVKRTSVKAIFVGHNHGLDWCCPYKMLWLCFARHTGYGGYGNWARGARILELSIVMSAEGRGTDASGTKTTLSYSDDASSNSWPEEASKYSSAKEVAGDEVELNVPEQESGIALEPKRAAKIHDFCFGIPYGGFVLSGGLIGFLFSRNLTTLSTGVLFGGALLALSTLSLKIWSQGKSSLPFILGQAVKEANSDWVLCCHKCCDAVLLFIRGDLRRKPTAKEVEVFD